MNELKPCPFHNVHPDKCGCLPVLLAHSFNDKVSKWNTRPIEDALRAEVAKANAEAERSAAEVMEWHKKAATWLASPEAAQRLEGYRELAMQLNASQLEVAALKADKIALDERCCEVQEAYDELEANSVKREGVEDIRREWECYCESECDNTANMFAAIERALGNNTNDKETK